MGRPLPGSAQLPGAARRAVRRRRSQAWALPRGGALWPCCRARLRRGLGVVRDLRVARPLLDGRLGDARREQHLAERVVRDRHAQPVGALRQTLERRRRRVHRVVAAVARRLQPELLPVRSDDAAERALRRVLGVGGAKDGATEVLPPGRPKGGGVGDLGPAPERRRSLFPACTRPERSPRRAGGPNGAASGPTGLRAGAF